MPRTILSSLAQECQRLAPYRYAGSSSRPGIGCTLHEFKEINRRDSPTRIPNRSRSIHGYDLSFFFFLLFFFSFFFHGRRMGLVLFGSLCRLQDSVIHRSFPGLYVRTIFGAAKEIWMGIRITDDHVTSGLFFV